MSEPQKSLYRWVPFGIVSALFLFITASTFTSLGVVFPFMVEELGLDFTQAGLGFTILALMVGLAGQLPAWTIRKIGIKGTFLTGGASMGLGFGLLATAEGLYPYLVGAGLAGLGYTQLASVPGIYVINRWVPDRQSFAIGAYFTIGGLGGIIGPSMVPAIVALTDSWRYHWWVMCVSVVVLSIGAALLIRNMPAGYDDEGGTPPQEEKLSARVYRTKVSWTFRDAVRTPQFAIITAAMTMTLFGAVSLNSWAVTHMGNMGVSIAFAAGALSAHQAVNALSRALGGVLATRIDPKWLLVAALGAETIGMIALAYADNPLTIAIFAIGEGFGYGMCLFATAILLLNYFGPDNNPELFGTLHLFTSVAAAGPVLGGFFGDTFGAFGGLFLIYAGVLAVVMAAAIWMRPPVKADQPDMAGD
ncbi:MAG: CynX/NimT family MFS transporter [Alphaproteobacteria bacterium]